jgi:hypothetical protein
MKCGMWPSLFLFPYQVNFKTQKILEKILAKTKFVRRGGCGWEAAWRNDPNNVCTCE